VNNLNVLALLFAMMITGSVFAADQTTSAGGASIGVVPKVQPASCPCGKEPDGSIKWCPCGSEGMGVSFMTVSTTAIVAGVAVAGVIAAVAGNSSSTTHH